MHWLMLCNHCGINLQWLRKKQKTKEKREKGKAKIKQDNVLLIFEFKLEKKPVAKRKTIILC